MTEIFTFSWQIFSNNIKYIALLSLPFILLACPSYFFDQPPENRNVYFTSTGLIIYIICYAMYMASLVFFLSQEYQRNLQSIKSNLINGFIYAPLLILTLVIANSPLIAAAALIFTSMSLSFLTLPLTIIGIYVSLKSTFAPFHLILEGYKPVGAIKQSFISTKGRIRKIVIIILVFYVATTIVEAASSFNTNNELFKFFMFMFGVAITLLMVALEQIMIFKIYINSFDNKKMII